MSSLNTYALYYTNSVFSNYIETCTFYLCPGMEEEHGKCFMHLVRQTILCKGRLVRAKTVVVEFYGS